MRVLIFFLISSVPIIPLWAAEERSLTLEDAYHLAQGHSLTVMQAAHSAANADDDVWSAAGNMLPSITLGGSRTRNWSSGSTFTIDIPGTGPFTGSGGGGRTDSYSLSAQANQTLFAGGALARQYLAARAKASSANSAYWAAKQDLLIATMQLYFAAIGGRETEEAARLAMVSAKNRERLTLRKYELKAATEVEKLQAETAARQAELTTLEAGNAAEIAQANLCRALGLPIDARLDFPFEAPNLANLPSEEECMARAEKGRPEIAQARANLAAARNSKWAAFGGYLPTVSANASYNWSDDQPPGENPWDEHDSHSVGLQFSWNLFDRFATPTSFAKLSRAARFAEETNNQMIDETRLQVHTAYLNLTKSQRKLELTTAARTSATAALRLMERSYELGGASFLEVSDAQASYMTAEADHIKAKYELLVNWATLKRQMGELAIDSLWQ